MKAPFQAFSFLADVVSINDLVLPAFPYMHELFLQRYDREPEPVEFLEHAAVGYVNLSNSEVFARNPDSGVGFSTFEAYIDAFKYKSEDAFNSKRWVEFRAQLDDAGAMEKLREQYRQYFQARHKLCSTVDISTFFNVNCHLPLDVYSSFNILVHQKAAIWGVERAVYLAVENHVFYMVIVFPAKVNAHFHETVLLFEQRLAELRETQSDQFIKRFETALEAIRQSVYIDGGDFSRLLKRQNGTFTLLQTHTNRRMHLLQVLASNGVDGNNMNDQELTDLLMTNKDLLKRFIKHQRESIQERNNQIGEGHNRGAAETGGVVERMGILGFEKEQQERFPLSWDPELAYTFYPGDNQILSE